MRRTASCVCGQLAVSYEGNFLARSSSKGPDLNPVLHLPEVGAAPRTPRIRPPTSHPIRNGAAVGGVGPHEQAAEKHTPQEAAGAVGQRAARVHVARQHGLAWPARSRDLNVDAYPDDMLVLALGPRMRCSCCGHLGATVRADWSQLHGVGAAAGMI
jgi:hypothetical protein